MDELTPYEIEQLRISLKEHYDKIIDLKINSLEKRMDSQFCSLEKAVEIAKTSMDTRMGNTNEWRQTVNDMISKLVTRIEINTIEDKIESEIRSLKDKLEDEIKPLHDLKITIDSKASQKSILLAYGITLISLIINIILFVYKISGK